MRLLCRGLYRAALAAAALGLVAGAQAGAPADTVHLAFQQRQLPNGLRVILAPDTTAPVYSLCVTYDVGSRDERPGRTGFAHLFEHMMFQGSEQVGKGEHILLVENNGGTFNGTTNKDRTNFFETLPANQLDLGLFLESDRMRALDISAANLENQRQTVEEERRQSYDNQAFGHSDELLDATAYDFPAYQHSTIGAMTDLNAATLADVRAFFKTYYAPNNAVLTLVGDFDPAVAWRKIQAAFGPIAAQPQPARPDMTQPPQTAERRRALADNFANNTRLDAAWHIPAGNTPDWYALAVLADVLTGSGGGGRGGRGGANISRLGQDLVDQKQLASSVNANAAEMRGPGLFNVTANLRAGHSEADLETALYADLAAVGTTGITAEELQRALINRQVTMVRSLQTSLSRAELLGQYAVYYNDPGLVNTRLDKFRAVTAADVQRVARQYLTAANRTVVVTTPAGAGAAQ